MLDLKKRELDKVAAIPEKVQDLLVETAGEDLCHLLGTKFSTATIGCLTGKAGDGGDRDLDFQADVVNVLRELAPSERERLELESRIDAGEQDGISC